MNFEEAVINEAKSWVGMQEKPGNMGWKEHSELNTERFKNLMQQVGFVLSHAWCAYFCELVWTVPTYSGKSKYFDLMVKLFSGSVMTTYRNFRDDKSGLFEVSKTPTPGALVIWQSYKNGIGQITGHMGIFEAMDGETTFSSFEGNTNAEGGREGVEVARMLGSYRHNLTTAFEVKNGLRLIAFISLKK